MRAVRWGDWGGGFAWQAGAVVRLAAAAITLSLGNRPPLLFITLLSLSTPPLPASTQGCETQAAVKVVVASGSAGVHAGLPQSALTCGEQSANFAVLVEIPAAVDPATLEISYDGFVHLSAFQCPAGTACDTGNCTAGAVNEVDFAPHKVIHYDCSVASYYDADAPGTSVRVTVNGQ